jgi:hypothetical protein
MEDSKSAPVGSLVGRNEASATNDCHTQPSEPVGNKDWITSMVLKLG